MARLEINKPLITRESTLEIDGLPAGEYHIQLRVIDDAGNISNPDIVRVVVQRGRRPFDPIDVNPTRVLDLKINRLRGRRDR